MKRSANSQAIKSIKKNKIYIAIIGIAVVAFVLIAVIAISQNREQKHTSYVFDTNSEYVQGIDVSHHNAEIDWDTVYDEMDFAFIRVGYRGYANGEINEDRKAAYNLKNANRAGIPVGVYFYSQAINEREAKEEAKYLINYIKKYDVSLPVVIDFEYPANSEGVSIGRLLDAKLTEKEATDIVNSFCEAVYNAGYTPGVYASSYTYKADFIAKDIHNDAVIWVADYNQKITYSGDYSIWQYTKSGQCDGVGSKNVDINYWYIK